MCGPAQQLSILSGPYGLRLQMEVPRPGPCHSPTLLVLTDNAHVCSHLQLSDRAH